MGHAVRCYEALGSWSLTNLLRNEGERAIAAIDEFRRGYPELDVRFYDLNGTLPQVMAEELNLINAELSHIKVAKLFADNAKFIGYAPSAVEVLTFGGSPWLIGAQLSPIGDDMIQEGVLLHFEEMDRLASAEASA